MRRRSLLLPLLLPFSGAFHVQTNTRSLISKPFKSALQFRDLHPHEEATVSRASRLQQEPSFTPINMELVQNLCNSQLLIFIVSTAFAMIGTGSSHLETLNWSSSPPAASDPAMMAALAFFSTFPMVFLSNHIEFSSSRDASRVNFRTNNLVVQLFGRRTSHWHAAQVTITSVLLSSLTAISEEIVFRLYIPVAIVALTHSVPLAMVGQALLFGAGHFHSSSSAGENRMVVGLQTTNGLLQGGLYVVSGGNMLPCILSHMLYDLHVFVESWHQVNEQIDWAEQDHDLHDTDELDIERLKVEADHQLTPETLGFCRRFFYAFDYEHCGALSLDDVQRAVCYAFLQDEFIPSETQVRGLFYDILDRRDNIGEERLKLSEFLRLLFTLRSRSYQKRTNHAATA